MLFTLHQTLKNTVAIAAFGLLAPVGLAQPPAMTAP